MARTSPRYVVYARRSSDTEDQQALSIEQQLDALRDLARVRGFDVAEELTESASAKDPGRPVFRALMKKVRERKVHGILVWSVDRLARNMVDGGEVIYYLSNGDLAEIVTPSATYTGTPDSKFLMAMLFGSAMKYSDDLGTAVRRGNEDVLRRGRVPGPVPLGYMETHEHDPVGAGIAIADPERFDTVKELWGAVIAGETNVTELWRKARDWGLTTRPTKGTLARPIALTNLYSMLRNPFYAGKIKCGSTLYKGEHPPMITWDQFLAVQKVIGHPKRREEAAPRLSVPRTSSLRCLRPALHTREARQEELPPLRLLPLHTPQAGAAHLPGEGNPRGSRDRAARRGPGARDRRPHDPRVGVRSDRVVGRGRRAVA